VSRERLYFPQRIDIHSFLKALWRAWEAVAYRRVNKYYILYLISVLTPLDCVFSFTKGRAFGMKSIKNDEKQNAVSFWKKQ